VEEMARACCPVQQVGDNSAMIKYCLRLRFMKIGMRCLSWLFLLHIYWMTHAIAQNVPTPDLPAQAQRTVDRLQIWWSWPA